MELSFPFLDKVHRTGNSQNIQTSLTMPESLEYFRHNDKLKPAAPNCETASATTKTPNP